MTSQLQLFESRSGTDAWNVRISRRARRLSVRVYPGGRVEVVVPPGASAATVHNFVHSHREWIDKRVTDLSSAAPRALETRPTTIDLRAIGKVFQIEYRVAQSKDITVRAEPMNRLLLSGPVHTDAAISRALRTWLTAIARKELGMQLSDVARHGGFRFERVQARRQRTRWGSCSATGTISLNICLLFLEPAVVHYLLVHELCHTRHMNHSRRFWSLVEAHEPDYRRLDRELLRGWQHVPGWVFG